MKKLYSFLIALVVMMCATVAFAHHGPEKVTIKDAQKKQPAVTFPHAQHTKMVDKCETCHHTNKGLTAANDKDVKKCSSCHLNPKDNAPSMSEMSPKKNPFHILCVSCHKEQGKGPTACKECHAK